MKRVTPAEQKRLLSVQYSGSWPPGFLPNYSPYSGFVRGAGVIAQTTKEKQSSAGVKGSHGLAMTQVTTAMRAGDLEAIPNGRGTLAGMGKRTETNIDRNEKIRRGTLRKAAR